MKTRFPLDPVVNGLLATVCLALTISTVHAVEPTPVLVVGMYHMNNPGRDQHNLEADDVLAPKRQAEIEEFVRMLAEFKPTKICLEIPYSIENDEVGKAERRKDPGYNARYPEYLRGELEESANEIYQVGFRLAKLLGHERVYAVDAKAPHGGYRWNAVEAFAGENGLQPIIDAGDALSNAMMKDSQEMLGRMTVSEYLHEHNQPQNILAMQRAYTYCDAYISVDHDYIGRGELIFQARFWNFRIFRGG